MAPPRPEGATPALERVHADPHGAVLKPATEGGSVGLLLKGAGSFPNGSLLFRTDRHSGTVAPPPMVRRGD